LAGNRETTRNVTRNYAKVGMTDFAEKVYAIVQKIPRGQVMTYGEVARAAGRPKAPRAEGIQIN